LSIDKYIFENHGVYGRDYTEDGNEGLQEEAHERLEGELGNLMIAGEKGVGGGERDVVVDLSFWRKEERGWVEGEGHGAGEGEVWGCVGGFQGSEEVLWERIRGREERWKEEGLGEGRPVGRELLGQFVRRFEWPDGEGEIVVDVV
jgi:hypothetical protein